MLGTSFEPAGRILFRRRIPGRLWTNSGGRWSCLASRNAGEDGLSSKRTSSRVTNVGDFHPHPFDLKKREILLGGQESVFPAAFPKRETAGHCSQRINLCGDPPQIVRRYRLALGCIKDLAFRTLKVVKSRWRNFDREDFQIPSLRQASAARMPSPLANCASDSASASTISLSSPDVS